MVWLFWSATYTLFERSTATPSGRLTLAALPVPLMAPATPARPANVLTTPAGLILRIVLLPSSATYRLLDPSSATLLGTLNRATPPGPSLVPAPPTAPAIVLVTQL